MRFGLERRSGHFDTTSRSVWGEDQCAETQALPFQIPYGYSKEKRPDLKPCVLSTLCVDRAGPMWGKPEDGHASDQTLKTRLLSEIAPRLAPDGVQPSAYISIAEAALGTADSLAALRDPLCSTRRPATYSACGRIIAAAVAPNAWQEGGVLAQTPPTQHRPGTFSKVAEGAGTLDGTTYRAVVVHSSSQDQRRQQPLERESRASSATLAATVHAAARQEYVCQADAEAAAAKLRALQSAYHGVEVEGKERPTYGPGRPSAKPPRVVNALRYRLQVTLHEQSESIARKRQETGGCVLLTNVPTAGEMAHTAGDVLQAYKAQQGLEPNDGFLKAPLLVHSVLLNKPERIEALGLVLLLALRLWRLVERTLRVQVETTGNPFTGRDKTATQQPTAFMMMTKFAGVRVRKGEGQRQLVHPLSMVQQQYLVELRVPATSCTAPQSG
jgi:transposase